MKIKSFLIGFFALIISCSAFSQDSTKTSTMHHHSTGTMHHKHNRMHHKHMMKEGSKADIKEDKKEAIHKKAVTEKKMDKKVESK